METRISTCYRVYTEDKGNGVPESIASALFPAGFTVYHADGFWLGDREQSLVIEIIGIGLRARVRNLASLIKERNHQRAVIVTESETEMITL